jgi:hypothetical protein
VVRAVMGARPWLSGNQQDQDMICEVFVLAPNDFVH